MAPAGDHNKPAGALLCPCLTKQGHFHSEPSEPSQPLYRAHIAIPPVMPTPLAVHRTGLTTRLGEQPFTASRSTAAAVPA